MLARGCRHQKFEFNRGPTGFGVPQFLDSYSCSITCTCICPVFFLLLLLSNPATTKSELQPVNARLNNAWLIHVDLTYSTCFLRGKQPPTSAQWVAAGVPGPRPEFHQAAARALGRGPAGAMAPARLEVHIAPLGPRP